MDVTGPLETIDPARPSMGPPALEAGVDAFAKELLDALLALRDGRFGVRLPPDLTGLNGKIADAFNDVATVSDRRAAESARVSRALGKEGKLTQRMNVPGALGGWADEVAAINTLIDDLVWPTTEVTRAAGAVAKGDLAQSMALEVDGRPLVGEFLQSAMLVNEMIDQLRGCAAEVTRVARESEELLKREQQAKNEAKRQSRLKDDFLATLSHELRTPMNAILGWLSILESGKPIRQIRSALAVVTRNAQVQAKLIDDLLIMNRLLSGDLRLDFAPIQTGSLLHATVQSLQPDADARGVTISASVDPAAGEICADFTRLQQVLRNLVHNAIKFSTENGRVEIRVVRDGDQMEFTVKDNGCGISPEFLPHVFDRFRQQDGSRTRSTSGVGLGLSIAEHLVDLHAGTITAYSAGERTGATFVVRMPVAPAAASIGESARTVL